MEPADPKPTSGEYKMEEYLGSEGSQPHTRPTSPGFQCQEEKSPYNWAIKTSGHGSAEEIVGFSDLSSWRALNMDFL